MSQTKYVLDRFEGGLAVLVSDQGETRAVPGLKGQEGDVFTLREGAFIPCSGETEARRARLRARMDGIFGKKDKKEP